MAERNYEKIEKIPADEKLGEDLFREKKRVMSYDVSQAELAWSTLKEIYGII